MGRKKTKQNKFLFTYDLIPVEKINKKNHQNSVEITQGLWNEWTT